MATPAEMMAAVAAGDAGQVSALLADVANRLREVSADQRPGPPAVAG